MRIQTFVGILLLSLSAVPHCCGSEVKKIAKIATIAYLVHRHLGHPKAPAAYHVAEPHPRLHTAVHDIVVDPAPLFNKLLRKTELVVSKMVVAQRLLHSLARLLKLADSLPPERIVPFMTVLNDDVRMTDKAMDTIGGNITQLLGLIQGPNGDIDVQKITHLLKTLQPKEISGLIGGTSDKNMKSSLVSSDW